MARQIQQASLPEEVPTLRGLADLFLLPAQAGRSVGDFCDFHFL